MYKPKVAGNPELTTNARLLRKNMTVQERRLWYGFLKNLPVHFRRQKVIDIYIVDFYCDELKLAIEIDGDQHYNSQDKVDNDKTRDNYLNRLGIKVLRYTNYEITANFNKVCNEIKSYIVSPPAVK
ncbi:MAG: endonuclease domain-containing protein [Ruminococcus sp.]|nr:endonuclease domain-containing protein [Ruminococcus sp.]